MILVDCDMETSCSLYLGINPMHVYAKVSLIYINGTCSQVGIYGTAALEIPVIDTCY